MKRYEVIAIYKGYGTLTMYETNSIVKAYWRMRRLYKPGEGYKMAIVDRTGGKNA